MKIYPNLDAAGFADAYVNGLTNRAGAVGAGASAGLGRVLRPDVQHGCDAVALAASVRDLFAGLQHTLR